MAVCRHSNRSSVKVAVEAVLVMLCLAVGLPLTLSTGWTVWQQTNRAGTTSVISLQPVCRSPQTRNRYEALGDHYGAEEEKEEEKEEEEEETEEEEEEETEEEEEEETEEEGEEEEEEEEEKEEEERGLKAKICSWDDNEYHSVLGESRQAIQADNSSNFPLTNITDDGKPCCNNPNALLIEEAEKKDDFIDKHPKTPICSKAEISVSKHRIEETQPHSPSPDKQHTSGKDLLLWSPTSPKERIPQKAAGKDLGEKGDSHAGVSSKRHYGAVRNGDARPTKISAKSSLPLLKEDVVEEAAETSQRAVKRGVKARLGVLMASTSFTSAMAYLFTMGISDYVAKAVFRGDPQADAGTESQLRYERGVQTASKALCIHYISYLFFNVLNPRLLKYIECRAEFLLAQVVMAGTMVVLALTARLEVVFVLAAAAGFHRITFHVLPYTAATHIVRTKDPEGTHLGFVLSLITCAIPIGACLLFMWMGPLEQLTGVVSTPLWMGAFYGCMSVLAFFFVGDVE